MSPTIGPDKSFRPPRPPHLLAYPHSLHCPDSTRASCRSKHPRKVAYNYLEHIPYSRLKVPNSKSSSLLHHPSTSITGSHRRPQRIRKHRPVRACMNLHIRRTQPHIYGQNIPIPRKSARPIHPTTPGLLARPPKRRHPSHNSRRRDDDGRTRLSAVMARRAGRTRRWAPLGGAQRVIIGSRACRKRKVAGKASATPPFNLKRNLAIRRVRKRGASTVAHQSESPMVHRERGISTSASGTATCS